MKRMLIPLLLLIFLVAAAGCASVPESPTPTSKTSQTPTETTKTTLTPSEMTPPASSDATPETTPEAAFADSDAGSFFFHPPVEAPGEVAIHIYKTDRALELIMDGEVAGRFPIGLGFTPAGDKEKQGDGRTPEGAYYVCTRNDATRYYLSLGVSYPNTEDARRGMDSGLIDRETYERIAAAQEQGARPDWDTALGGDIAIHSGGSATDWTAGCIATEDDTMDILWEYCAIGTPIMIYE